MPKKVKLEDGTEIEVPTDEEIAAFKKAQTDLDALKADEGQKNWRELRQKAEDAETRAKAAEAERDELKKNPPKPPEGQGAALTPEQIREEARKAGTEAGREFVLSDHKLALLKQYSPEDQKTVGAYFDKLAAGETLTTERVSEIMKQAHTIVFPQQTFQEPVGGTGAPPRFKDTTQGGTQKDSFAETEEGKNIANEIFGQDSYAKPPAK